MKIKDMIKKVETINSLKAELGLGGKAKIRMTDKFDIDHDIYTLSDYQDYLKENEVAIEIQEILDNKKFTKIKDYYQLADIFYIGEYANTFEFKVEIYETNNY